MTNRPGRRRCPTQPPWWQVARSPAGAAAVAVVAGGLSGSAALGWQLASDDRSSGQWVLAGSALEWLLVACAYLLSAVASLHHGSRTNPSTEPGVPARPRAGWRALSALVLAVAATVAMTVAVTLFDPDTVSSPAELDSVEIGFPLDWLSQDQTVNEIARFPARVTAAGPLQEWPTSIETGRLLADLAVTGAALAAILLIGWLLITRTPVGRGYRERRGNPAESTSRRAGR